MRNHTRTTLTGLSLAGMLLASAPVWAQGVIEEILVPSPALEGNLEGNDSERKAHVYLPPSYESEPDRRYPVLYTLHGYAGSVEGWTEAVKMPDSANAAIAAGAQEMIIVAPDADTVHGGSMYSSSVTIGDWEGFIADDLTGYIDANYRTIPEPEARGLAGHSMGGFGTIRIGMKRPGVFSSLYILSACCLAARGADGAAMAPLENFTTREEVEAAGFMSQSTFAVAAAWSANPDNPPFFVDLPTKGGEIQQDVVNRWAANAPIVMLDQYIPALKSYKAIAMDTGDEDPGIVPIEKLHARMTLFGIEHSYDVYEGDHGNRIAERFEEHVLPFFSEQLQSE